ncbi:response regulator transcription factor [Paenibacillus sp. WQ 127069]|uniref:Response regulator transcription factor n=1 Tax=Paenibacillus baimaensis TaxID=2982185 RepID=A0ABT2UJ68_9BACL|nr:response regulator transcription factor [Paenibacillus sp. WQ 127069]MCU6794680.1 response regulator transcription factor [Paenibacillus sp. WQ 127069]
MYKVVIVEDEWLVLQGLKLTIPWEDMHCSIIGEASDGVTGLEVIQQEQPDILLTDIRMPAMDGIQLAEKAALLWPKMKIVFLTGFDDFTYAQKAVKLGAADFVLKPTNADELIRVIGRITSKLDEEKQRQSLQERMELRYSWEHPLILEKMLYDMLLDYAGTMEKEWLLEYGGSSSEEFSSYRVLLLQLDGLHTSGAAGEQLKQGIKEQMAVLSTLPAVRIHENRYALVVNRIIDRAPLTEKLDQLSPLLPIIAESHVLGASEPCINIEQLPTAYQQAMSALYQTVFVGQERMIWFEDMDRQQDPLRTNYTRLEELIDLVKWGNPASIKEMTEIWYSQLIHRHTDGLEARRRFFEYTVTLYSLLLRDSELRGIVLDSSFSLASAERVEETLELSLKRLNTSLFEWNRKYTEQSDTHKKSGFEEIEAFIQAHYAEDITLQSIAERHHMSESYFSRLFKKQVGTSFLEYITQIRMRHAKELLTNPRLKIYEVSVQVGYQDSRYFSQIFRKYTGETPTEFRKRLGIESLPL